MQSGLVLRPGGRVWSATLRKKKLYHLADTELLPQWAGGGRNLAMN